MKRGIVLSLITIALVLTLSGCPNGLSGGNSFTLHNNFDDGRDIYFFSITRIGDIGDDAKEKRINILPEPISPGESFTVNDLVDGNYAVYARYYAPYPSDFSSGTQSLEGGRHYDWYLGVSKSDITSHRSFFGIPID